MKVSEANKLRILYFLAFSCTASWLPIFAEFLRDQGLTGIRIGIVLGITPLLMFVVQPFYGALADRIGYKKSLTWSSAFASLFFAGYLIHGGFAWLFMLTILMSIFYNSIQPLLDSLSLGLTAKNPGFSYGSLRIAGAAGWAFTGMIVGHYIDLIDTSVIFIVSSISIGLCFVFSFTLSNDIGERPQREQFSWREFRQVFGNKTLIFLLVSVFLVSAGSSTIYFFYSIYMKENGASSSLIGFAISFQGLCELPLFYFSSRIIRRFGVKRTLLITIFATAVRMLLYASVKNPYLAVSIELLHGVSWSLFWVVVVEYVNQLVPPSHRAAGQSLLTAAFYGIGWIVGNMWTGFLYGTSMKIAGVYLLNAGLVSLVGLLIWLVMRDRTNRGVGEKISAGPSQ